MTRRAAPPVMQSSIIHKNDKGAVLLRLFRIAHVEVDSIIGMENGKLFEIQRPSADDRMFYVVRAALWFELGDGLSVPFLYNHTGAWISPKLTISFDGSKQPNPSGNWDITGLHLSSRDRRTIEAAIQCYNEILIK